MFTAAAHVACGRRKRKIKSVQAPFFLWACESSDEKVHHCANVSEELSPTFVFPVDDLGADVGIWRGGMSTGTGMLKGRRD